MNVTYTFTLDIDPESASDPDDPDFWSIFLDNGCGASAEVAGRIGHKEAAEYMLNHLNALSQDEIKALFQI